LSQQLGAKYMNRLSITFDAALLTEEAPGSNLTDRVKALAQHVAADPAHAKELLRAGAGSGGQLVADQHWTPADTERKQGAELATGPLFGTAAGSVVAYKYGGRSTAWLVAYISDRKTDATPPAGQPVNPGKEDTQVGLGQRLLAPLAGEAGLKINPRYGVWDP